MKITLCITLYFLIYVNIVSAKTCGSFAEGCQHDGVCEDDKCKCQDLYDGDDCSTRWFDSHNHFKELFILFVVISAVLHVTLVVFCIQQIYVRCTKKKWNLAVNVLIGVLLGAILRVIFLALDPYGATEILPRVLGSIIFNLAVFVWLFTAFLLFLYWITVVKATKELSQVESDSTRRLRITLFICLLFVSVVVLPIGLWNYVKRDVLSTIIYNAVLLLCLVAFIIISLVFGLQLLRTLNARESIKSSGQSSIMMTIKLTRFMISLNVFLILIIITLCIFTVVGNRQAWSWLILHFILRVLEFGIAMSFLLLIAQKKRNFSGSSFESRSYKTEYKLDHSISGSTQ